MRRPSGAPYIAMKERLRGGRLRDALILLLLFAVCVGGTLAAKRLLFGAQEESVPARIVIRVGGAESALCENLGAGERILDRTNRRLLGTVERVEQRPALTERPTEGGTVTQVREGVVDLWITVIPDHEHTGYFVTPRVWRVGQSVTFATPSFAGVGRIVSVER